MSRILSKEDLLNFIQGAGLLGTGGGGLISAGEQIIENIISQNKKVCLINYQEISEKAIGISTAILGGGISKKDIDKIEMVPKTPLSLKAAKSLQNYLEKKIEFVFAIEIGPQNSVEAIQLAAFLDVPLLDGDFVGRAIPEMQQTTLSLNNIPLTPFSIATFKGDSIIVANSKNDKRNEEISRNIANISGGLICIAGLSLPGKVAKKIMIPDTISKCIEIGKIINNKSKNLFSEILDITNGIIAFKGIVTDIIAKNVNSFFVGEIMLKGIDEFSGNNYKVWYKNEYLISWKNDKVDITCPDLICLANSKTGVGKISYGQGFRNEIVIGEELTILAIPSPDVWLTEKGLDVLSPKHFEFNIEYKPLKIN